MKFSQVMKLARMREAWYVNSTGQVRTVNPKHLCPLEVVAGVSNSDCG